MSYGHEKEQERADARRSSPGVARLVGQMLLLPFTVFVYGMELFVRTVRGMQQAADQGMDVMAGEAAPPLTGAPAGENRFTDKTAVSGDVQPPDNTRGGWGDLKVRTTISTGDGTVEEAAEAKQKETGKMRDKDLSDDQLKLVRYKILFVKRDYEVAFPEREELVHDNITGEAFTAWKVAEFIQRLGREPIPDTWRNKNYPRKLTDAEKRRHWDEVFIDSLSESDKKYLRVYYEVLDRYVREDEEDEVVVLRSIREAIDRLPRIEGSYAVESSSTGGGGTGGGTGGTGGGGGTDIGGVAGGGRGYSS